MLHFLSCFNVCAENRNILMHSMTKQADDAILHFAKASRNDPTKINALNLRSEDIRAVADHVNAAVNYGLRLHAFLAIRMHGTEHVPPEFRILFLALPDRPEKPNSLSKPPPAYP